VSERVDYTVKTPPEINRVGKPSFAFTMDGQTPVWRCGGVWFLHVQRSKFMSAVLAYY